MHIFLNVVQVKVSYQSEYWSTKMHNWGVSFHFFMTNLLILVGVGHEYHLCFWFYDNDMVISLNIDTNKPQLTHRGSSTTTSKIISSKI